MGGVKQSHQDRVLGGKWSIKKADDDICESASMESSFEDSAISVSSSSSADAAEDAASSSSSSNGPLYELSELMSQLPIKRGLSKFYQGKSQSFLSLSSVKSLEDLAKKGCPYRRKIKTCKSFGGGLDGHKYSPKATISKKASRGSFLSSVGKGCNLMGDYRLPTHVHKNF